MIEVLKEFINTLSLPWWYLSLLSVLFVIALWKRDYTTKLRIALPILLLPVVFFCVSVLDPNFRLVVTKPDNVPIVALLFLVIFFTWFPIRKAVENDRRRQQGQPTFEDSETKQKVLVWPDLVYSELICLVLCTVILIVWSIVLPAPIEEPANPTRAPNPSKAPWYFLGLQEMLVYFDPWIAGVLLPGLIIVGLMAIPYLDTNPRGNGYYTFAERKWEVSLFLFGFAVLWVSLIILGTFLRGPNWNFFGPYEFWDVHKVEPLVNVNLSEILFVWTGIGLPGFWLLRELPGILLLLGYFVVLPPLLARTLLRRFYLQMGFARYNVFLFLLLWMLLLPIKMYLRWLINFKYIVAIPEYFFNV